MDNRWISVDKSLPKLVNERGDCMDGTYFSNAVLLRLRNEECNHTTVTLGTYYCNIITGFKMFDFSGYSKSTYKVTHWMYIPDFE